MVVFPHAKINIGLNILRKRSDGYHDLETLFYPLGWKDALEFVENGRLDDRLTVSGYDPGVAPQNNLVMKALGLLRQEWDLPGLDLHLHKAIPFGAGLGGGSSDAAFLLKALNEYFQLGISHEVLRLKAKSIGADCPFFLEKSPCFATGIGDQLTTAHLSLKGVYLCLVKPPFGVDTRTAYAGVVPKPFDASFQQILEGDPVLWSGLIKNDFEPSLFRVFPQLEKLKGLFLEHGAFFASVSGSGSSVFGLFRADPGLSVRDFAPGSILWQETFA
ncbi:MAG: 4-(cytidine 5'-diphospho)-2-C-methyl-D-erythritol kinase [Marinilabiliales bacterium]|nr:4-(cytidine 5'-diphospho)-2-C-methyl-D-erythritol kinase [Marinilabiliales bacterium]